MWVALQILGGRRRVVVGVCAVVVLVAAACSGGADGSVPAASDPTAPATTASGSAPTSTGPAGPTGPPATEATDPTTTVSATQTSAAPNVDDGPCGGDAPAGTALVLPAGERYHNVIPRADHTSTFLYDDLRYEGNNIVMRGPANAAGLVDVSGDEINRRWRTLASQTSGVFLLRDSLWSQQDHPYQHRACAFMLPPNWITAAVAAAVPTKLNAPAIDDDPAWAALGGDPIDVFGTFPTSDTLHGLATAVPTAAAERMSTDNARATLITLADLADQLLAARAVGGEAAAIERGAELIAASDRAYFGDLRRAVIPIMVPNTNDAEIDEGKGFAAPGFEVSDARLDQIANAVYRRRLVDGDLALERYDLSDPAERAEAIETLSLLIPPDGPDGGRVWLWINGRLDPDRKLRGENPTAYFPEFSAELAAAEIDLGRLRFVSKPTVEFDPGPAASAAFEAEVDRYAALGLPLSVNVDAAGLSALIAP